METGTVSKSPRARNFNISIYSIEELKAFAHWILKMI